MTHIPREELLDRILQVTPAVFEAVALEVFRYQAVCNPVYQRFLELLGVNPQRVRAIPDIPFLPISLFKTQDIQTGGWKPEAVFLSSATTGQRQARHFIRSLEWYRRVSIHTFQQFYGPVENYCFLALLPAYLERQASSLVYMVEQFVKKSPFRQSGFFLYDHDALRIRLEEVRSSHIPCILIGVSFALLDFAEAHPMPLAPVVVMETGGMKGRRKELIRSELHGMLQSAFQAPAIHSEYGMTELQSQAYSTGEGIFRPGPYLRLYTRELLDPFCLQPAGKTGPLNAIDLANLDTCTFIATDDLGKVHADGSFEVLGRTDNSDIRGCNLMI